MEQPVHARQTSPPASADVPARAGRSSRRFGDVVAAVAAAVLWTVAIDVTTPAFDARTYRWDSAIYLDMAERGVSGNDTLVAPFAYRFVAPVLARTIAQWPPLSVDDGFRIVTYAGVIAELVLVYALARLIGAASGAAFVVMAVAALSLFNVRFLLFDIYRPDALAFALTLLSTWMLLAGWPGPAAGLAAAGVLVREFLVAPLAAGLVALVRRPGPWRWRLTSLAVPVSVAAVGIVLPRVLIPVHQNVAATDPFRGDLLRTLWTTPLSGPRDINIVFCLASYLLPLLALGSGGRLSRAWASLGEARSVVVVSAALTVALTMYGGTDVARFTAYLVAVQTILLAAVFREGVSPIEAGLTLLAVAVFNRVHVFTVPMEPIDRYLDFYGGFADRVNAATAWRAIELVAWIVAVRVAGVIVTSRNRQPVSSPQSS
jgi:hypothetical protein